MSQWKDQDFDVKFILMLNTYTYMLVLMLILILLLEKQPCLACVALAFKTLKSYMNMAMPMKRYVLLGRAVGRGSTGPVSARFRSGVVSLSLV